MTIEGYLVWLDRSGRWHTAHDYALNVYEPRGLLSGEWNRPQAVQVWQIPLPTNLPTDHFERQRAVGAFRALALRIAKTDYNTHTLSESTNRRAT